MPDAQVVEHPAGADAAGRRLDGDRDRQRPRGRRRDGVGAPDRAAGHRQLQRQELPGLVAEPGAARRDEADRRDVRRLGHDGAALERLVVGPGRRARRGRRAAASIGSLRRDEGAVGERAAERVDVPVDELDHAALLDRRNRARAGSPARGCPAGCSRRRRGPRRWSRPRPRSAA